MRGGTERDMAGSLVSGMSRRKLFRGILRIQKKVRNAKVARNDPIALFNGSAIKEECRHPLPRGRFPKIDKRTSEAVGLHFITPCLFPTQLEGAPAIEKRDRPWDEALNEVGIEHGGECGRKEISSENCISRFFE